MTAITVVGNAAKDPELRFTPSGTPVASFSLAVNKRAKDGDQWVDAGTDWYRVTCWRDLGQNVAESVEKGMRVVVTGTLSQRTWEAQDGSERLNVEINADEVAPSLRWATAEVHKAERREGNGDGWAPREQAPANNFDPSEEPF